MTWRHSNITLTNKNVCLSVTSLNDNVTWSIYHHRGMKLVGLVSGKGKYYRFSSFRLDHSRPNIRYEFALKLRRIPKPSNASSSDSSMPYENLAQLETFILWNPGCDWQPCVACVVRWPISNVLLNDIWLTCWLLTQTPCTVIKAVVCCHIHRILTLTQCEWILYESCHKFFMKASLIL